MKRTLVIVGCGLFLLTSATAMGSGSVATTPSPLTPPAATSAFGHLLRQLYGPLQGYWTCPAEQAFNGNADCLGEVEAAGEWHQVSARAFRYHAIVDFHLPHAWTWTRRWSPYSRQYILRSHENAPGVVSVNSPAYDWGWLADCAAGTKPGHTSDCGAYDGNGAGFGRFFRFVCSRSGGVITCRNRLGDAMRYRPHG